MDLGVCYGRASTQSGLTHLHQCGNEAPSREAQLMVKLTASCALRLAGPHGSRAQFSALDPQVKKHRNALKGLTESVAGCSNGTNLWLMGRTAGGNRLAAWVRFRRLQWGQDFHDYSVQDGHNMSLALHQNLQGAGEISRSIPLNLTCHEIDLQTQLSISNLRRRSLFASSEKTESSFIVKRSHGPCVSLSVYIVWVMNV